MKRTFRSMAALFLALALLLSLSACAPAGGQTPAGATPTPVESDPTPEAEGLVLTDQGGRQVTIDGPVERLVSGYYISTSACIALGLTDKLVGIEAKADSRPIYSLAAPQLLELPNVGSAKEFDMEGCIALEPDLVILPKRLQDSAETMAQLGIPVLLVNPEGHQELVEMITLIGRATGTQERAQSLTDYYQAELEAVAALTQDLEDRPSVYLAGNSSYLTTAPKDMYQASLIDAAGGVNAAGQLEGDNWVEVSYEQLTAMNPQVIVLPAEASYTVQDLLDDPQLAQLSAIQEGKVYQMPRDFEAWDSPVPSCTLGIRWMLWALHEDLYSLEELRADAAGFYQTFYGVEIDTALIGR